MTLRLAINGFGRVGRCVLRALYERQQQAGSPGPAGMQVVAINELADLDTIAYLTRYDSTHGRFPGRVELASEGSERLLIEGDEIQVTHQQSLAELPWAESNVDLVLECTGTFAQRSIAQQHIAAGAKAVMFSQPAEADIDATVVYGINHRQLSGEHKIISAASCTTNCVVPAIKTLHDALGVEAGVITTIHSAMNDQPVLDSYHDTDLRKTRAAFQSIIPVETGLAKGIDRILPELSGRFEAQAMRVPTQNVSAIDLSVQVGRDTSSEEVNTILRAASEGPLSNILGFTEEPLASCDFNHDAHSGVVDASQTRVGGQRLVKVLLWFDNEWGYANRMLDVVEFWKG